MTAQHAHHCENYGYLHHTQC